MCTTPNVYTSEAGILYRVRRKRQCSFERQLKKKTYRKEIYFILFGTSRRFVHWVLAITSERWQKRYIDEKRFSKFKLHPKNVEPDSRDFDFFFSVVRDPLLSRRSAVNKPNVRYKKTQSEFTRNLFIPQKWPYGVRFQNLELWAVY